MRSNSKGHICKIHIIERRLQLVIILLEVHMLHTYKETVVVSTQAVSNTETINQ